MAGATTYLTPEAQARIDIDKMLDLAGWVVQDPDAAASLGRAQEEVS